MWRRGIKRRKLISGGRNESVALSRTLASTWETLTAPTDGRRERKAACVEALQRDGGLFLALFAVALTSGQAAFQLLWHPLIAVLAHRPQVNFNKLISELVQPSAALEEDGVRRKGHETDVNTRGERQ